MASELAMWTKAVVDRAAAAVLLILLSPVLAVTALLVLFTMGRPVLFRQSRAGHRRRLFEIIKFRTMTNDRDASGNTLPDGARLTTAGRFLRETSLDELPELYNVLRGELSLIGPRPLLAKYLNRYSAEQARRHNVVPGITGWAQVNGRNDLSWDEKFALDVWYVDHWSLWLDFRIAVKTLWRVVKREGISRRGFATTAEFMGSTPCNDVDRI